MKKLFDLRFVIGLFFLIVGILLLGYSLLSQTGAHAVNTWCGGLFGVFGLVMIIISFGKDAHDELL